MGRVSASMAPIVTAEALACVRCGFGSLDDLDNTFQSVELGRVTPPNPNPTGSSDFPECGFSLSHFQLKMTGLAGLSAAPTITSRLTWDPAGDCYAGNEDVDTILLGMTTATDGGLVINYAVPGAPIKRPAGIVGTPGKMYLWLQMDQGTADNVEVLAYFRPLTACCPE